MDVDKGALRAVLVERYPWLDDELWGPRNVEAGECDDCSAEARLVETCGPGAARYLGRRCAEARGVEAWCDGHAEEAAGALRWAEALPTEADDVARLWWVATGEVRLDPELLQRLPELEHVKVMRPEAS